MSTMMSYDDNPTLTTTPGDSSAAPTTQSMYVAYISTTYTHIPFIFLVDRAEAQFVL